MKHIPLKVRGFSGPYNDNCLFQKEITKTQSIYVMDNHRLALWCWLSLMYDLPPSDQSESFNCSKFNFLHIDAHPDQSTFGKDICHDILTREKLLNLTLEEFRAIQNPLTHTPLFQWDNYLEIFLDYFSDRVPRELTWSCTHHHGSSKELYHPLESQELIQFLDRHFTDKVYLNDFPWIINIDLDYFFTKAPHKIPMYSESYLEKIRECFLEGLLRHKIAMMTVSLSPECCGSYDHAESVLKKIFSLTLDDLS